MCFLRGTSFSTDLIKKVTANVSVKIAFVSVDKVVVEIFWALKRFVGHSTTTCIGWITAFLLQKEETCPFSRSVLSPWTLLSERRMTLQNSYSQSLCLSLPPVHNNDLEVVLSWPETRCWMLFWNIYSFIIDFQGCPTCVWRIRGY